jgi:hypothetical protein
MRITTLRTIGKAVLCIIPSSPSTSYWFAQQAQERRTRKAEGTEGPPPSKFQLHVACCGRLQKQQRELIRTAEATNGSYQIGGTMMWTPMTVARLEAH